MFRLLAAAVICASVSGCLARNRINPDCGWTNDPASTLDLASETDRQHLATDAAVAEDLAIRNADALRGLRSGHWIGNDEYRLVRDRCMARMVAVIAARHRVDPQQVRSFVGRRPAGFDTAVLLGFAIFYGLTAFIVSRSVLNRFLDDGPVAAAVATAFASALTSAAGVGAFQLWASVAEMIRLGNEHLSYRTGRVPLSQHGMGLFLLGVALFWAASVVQGSRVVRAREGTV
ncbi:MAG: hypothetical protein ACM3SQ_17590 [Betaproteobacteria bacterium]